MNSVSPASREPSAQSPSDDGLKLDLRFIRTKILRMMVTGIATARAETPGEIATSNQATVHAVAVTIAGSNLAAAQLACAIVAALADRGVLNPADVIKWANWMADHATTAEPAAKSAAARILQMFTTLLTSTSIAASRPEGPSARN